MSASIARASGSRPASTAASRTPSAVSRPLIPLAARPNSTALSTSVCGAWSVAIASTVPSRSAARQAAASSGGPERRVHPQGTRVRRRDERLVRPRVAAGLPRPATRPGDPLVGQREVMGRDVAGDRQAGRLGAADEIQRRARRQVREVEPSARHIAEHVLEDREVTGDGRRFGRDRPAAQTEDRRDETVVRLGALGQARFLGVVDDRQPERARVGQRRPQDRRGPDRRPVVGEPDDAGIGQLAERRQPLPCPPDRHRAVRQQLDRRARRDGRGSHPCQHTRLVQARRRVGHRADRREPAMGGRGQPGRHRLGVLVAGLAQVGVEVDEAGRDDDPARRRSRRRPRRSAT